MELNIATDPAKQAPFRVNQNKPRTNGSWKKRHRERSLEKAKQRRLEGHQQQRKKRERDRLDEFSSGIEVPKTKSSTKNGFTGEKEDGKKVLKRPRDSKSFDNAPNIVIEGMNGNAKSISDSKPAVRKRARTPSSQPLKPARDDQKPEAVKAALAVIGAEAPSLKDRPNGKSAETVEKQEDDTRSERDDTFGTSSFKELGLYHSVVHHITERMGMGFPTKVQQKVLKTILHLQEGQQAIDVLVRSPTGSGKTLAYLLPVAHYLLNRTRRVTRKDGALAVIIAPTRELADQVEEVASRLFQPWHWIVTGSVVGGESKRREKARLRKGVNVLVGTPGRLLDHMRNTQSFLYGMCEFLVLDEADRLLDLGFEDEVQELVRNLDRQSEISSPGSSKLRSNILLSATLRPDVQQLAKYSLRDPVTVSVSTVDQTSGKKFAMPKLLQQHFCIVEQRYRLVTLACFLRLRALKGGTESEGETDESSLPTCKIIVFFSTCDSVDFHYDLFKRAMLPSELRRESNSLSAPFKFLPLDILRLHGNHAQVDRTDSLRAFRGSRRAVLLCTDVAARGLDLKGLNFAVQYDPPTGGKGEELEYLHRAGRTARMGSRGDALLFLLPSERAYIGKLESKGITISEISSSAALAALDPRVNLSSQDSISYSTRLVTSALQESFETIMKEDEKMKHLAVSGFQAYCRAYATHAKEVRYFFHVRNLHLGHVARAFTLSGKPAEFSEMMAEIKKAKAETETRERKDKSTKDNLSKQKRRIAQAIADGEAQPYNDQSTELARRRREKGSGKEAFKELALEFGS